MERGATIDVGDELRRRAAELDALSEAQERSGWLLRNAVTAARSHGASWRWIADIIGMDFRTLNRQYRAGGPIVVFSPYSPTKIGPAASGK